MMIYEIRVKSYMKSEVSNQIGYFYYNKETADRVCERLNNQLNVYFVAPVKMQDEIKD